MLHVPILSTSLVFFPSRNETNRYVVNDTLSTSCISILFYSILDTFLHYIVLLNILCAQSWDPSISLPELFFCIQQLLVHPNHRGPNTHHNDRAVYDPIEYQRIVLEQSEKYQYNIGGGNNGNGNAGGTNNNNSNKFLELAMVELQSNIDPEYKKPLEAWENERWENLEHVRWKGQRSFQQRVVVVQGLSLIHI